MRAAISTFALLLAAAISVPTETSAQDAIFPLEPKVAFDHDNVTPSPVDHQGGSTNNLNPMPWMWHPMTVYENVAGVHFKLKYDPYEVNILGVNPAPPGFGGVFMGHHRFDPPAPLT